ncbi:MAG: acetyl-coenzyme A synthetase N-terminal domain-containing protein [Nocardioidaceae bacterium]
MTTEPRDGSADIPAAVPTSDALSNLLHENRRFEPPADLAAVANVTAAAYEEADADPLAFWARQAERISWSQQFDEVLDWSDPPFTKWYVGGRLNAAIMVVPELPTTRSGKIMRRLLQDVAEHRETGDATTLADSTVMDQISSRYETGATGDEE